MMNFAKSYWYIFALGISFTFLVFYGIYFFYKPINIFFEPYEEFIEYLKSFCLLLFTGGIFTASLKYLQFLKVFEKEFERIIDSPKFNQKLKKTLSAITFSEEFLNEQSDLNVIWKKVTISKYKNEFPELYEKISKNLKNELFHNKSLNKYYKNVVISYELELIDEYTINIVEHSSFTIIRNKTEEFKWIFFLTFSKEIEENLEDDSSVLNKDETKIDGTKIDISKCKISHQERGDDFIKKQFTYFLKGKKEYHIERRLEFTQNLKEDRVIGFDTSHVIDDLTVHIKICKKLNLVFEPSGKAKFHKNEQFSDRVTYSNRDVFLPGEKYKLFLYKE